MVEHVVDLAVELRWGVVQVVGLTGGIGGDCWHGLGPTVEEPGGSEDGHDGAWVGQEGVQVLNRDDRERRLDKLRYQFDCLPLADEGRG